MQNHIDQVGLPLLALQELWRFERQSFSPLQRPAVFGIGLLQVDERTIRSLYEVFVDMLRCLRNA